MSREEARPHARISGSSDPGTLCAVILGMPRLSAVLLTACFAVQAGCAAGADVDFDDTDAIPPTVDTGPLDTGEVPTLEGDWMAVSGTIEVFDGQPVATDITIEVQASDAEGILNPVDCGARLVGEPIEAEQPDDEVSLFGLWRYDVDVGLCPDLPLTFEVGLGPLLPTLWPELEEDDASVRHSRGLYTPNSSRDGLWVFGYAGTPEQLQGVGLPVSLEPLPDGLYTVKSAYLLPL